MHVGPPREVGLGAGSVCREKIAPGNWREFLAPGFGNRSPPRPLAGMCPGMAAFILVRTEGCWPQPHAQDSPATPSIPLGRRKDIHPSVNLEPGLSLQWEYWWKGSPWRLGQLGESPPDPCGCAALGSPLPSPRSTTCLSPSQQKSVKTMLLLPGRRGNRQAQQGGMQDLTPISPPTLGCFPKPPHPHCPRDGSLLGGCTLAEAGPQARGECGPGSRCRCQHQPRQEAASLPCPSPPSLPSRLLNFKATKGHMAWSIFSASLPGWRRRFESPCPFSPPPQGNFHFFQNPTKKEPFSSLFLFSLFSPLVFVS